MYRAFSQNLDRYTIQKDNKNYSIGFVNEKNHTLGAKFTGAFATAMNSNTIYFMNNKSFSYKGWNITGTMINSFSKVDGLNGIINQIGNIYGNSFSVSASRGNFGFKIHQPLRVAIGKADVSYVNKVTNTNKLHFAHKTIDLTPSGRQINLETYYTPQGTNWTLWSYYIKDLGHIKNKNDLGVLLSYKVKF